LKAQRESEKIIFTLLLLFIKLCVIITVINGKESILMGDIQKYYENTENALPHPILKKFINMNINPKLKNFNFKCQDFENIELEKNNLLVANFSIPFCNKDYFNEFWNKISNSILRERILCWKLFWIKRFLGKDKRANGIFIKRTSIGII